MPTYDYVCQACGHRLEIFQSMTESPKRKCPQCKKQKLERQIGRGAAILFKGSGFYQTDYRSSSYAADAKKDASGSTGTSGSGDSSAAKETPKSEASPADSKGAGSKGSGSSGGGSSGPGSGSPRGKGSRRGD